MSKAKTAYETLRQSSHGWHQGKHDPWHYVNYVLDTLRGACQEFEQRVGEMASPRGEKRTLVLAALQRAPRAFRISDLLRKRPGASVDMVRFILKELRDKKQIKCPVRGRTALWKKLSGEIGQRLIN